MYETKKIETPEGVQFNNDSWFDVKFTLGLDFPNLPYLIDGDFKLTESDAIMKYIASKWKPELLGSGTQQFATVQMLSGVFYDLSQKLGGAAYPNPNKAEVAELGMTRIKPIAEFLAEKKYLVGD